MAGSPVASTRKELTVAPAEAGRRLDLFLVGSLPEMSRSRAQSLIRAGAVAIGGATIVEPKRPVKPGERVEIAIPEPVPAEPEGEEIPLDVVHEDDELIVIDKPAGLVVHPAAGNWTGTLVNALIAHCGESLSGIGGVRRPGIVHRLDKDTTGLIVVAKTDRAHRSLAAQFADHGREGPLVRRYLALVWGAPERPFGTIDAPLGRADRDRTRQKISERGREAVTHYELLERFGRRGEPPVASLLACTLETGRTHQIRVHLSSIGHPILGDATYGAGFATKTALLPVAARVALKALGRQALHAGTLGFAHPVTDEEMLFESDPPADMVRLIEALRAIGER